MFRAPKENPTAREYLLLHYEEGHWDFPKGHVEPGENDEQAATRELEEETGIGATEKAGTDGRVLFLIPGFMREFEYDYARAGKKFHKHVRFFLAELSGKDAEKMRVKLSNEHTGFAWLTFDKARKKLTFDNAKRLLDAAEGFLEQKTC